MIPSILILMSATIIGLLGLAHLVVTFFGPRLRPRDSSVVAAMEQSRLVITSETTVWKAWIGFNASHSLGAFLFAFVFGYLATQQPALFFDALFLQGLGATVLVAYLVLAKLYWFRIPRAGIGLSLLLYVAGIAMA